MPSITIEFDEETYSNISKYCGGKFTPETVVVHMVKTYIKEREEKD